MHTMKGFILLVFVVWPVERGTSDAISSPEKPNSFNTKSTITKRSVSSCPVSDPSVAPTDITRRKPRKKICQVILKRSSCIPCEGRNKTDFTVTFSRSFRKAFPPFFIQANVITVYSDYGDTALVCDLTVGNITKVSRNVQGYVSCYKDANFVENGTKCRKYNEKNKSCFFDCTNFLQTEQLCSTDTGMAILVGGVVGSVLGGVVITMVVVAICCICRRRRSKASSDAVNRDSRSHIGLTPGGISSKGPPATGPDVIQLSPMAEETSTNVYEELPDYRLSVRNTGDSKGEYVELKDQDLDGGATYSLEKACSRPLPSPFVKPNSDETQTGKEVQDTYNILGSNSGASGVTPDTYNRAGEVVPDQTQLSSEYFVLEENHEDHGSHNQLGAHSEPNDRSKEETFPEYFVLEDGETSENHNV